MTPPPNQPIIIPPVQMTSLTPLECDFCSAIRPELTFFAVEAFAFQVHQTIVDVHAGAFGACETCAPVVAARDVQGMIRRTEPKTLTALEYASKLHAGLARHMLKEPAPIVTSVRLLPDNGRWVESDTSKQTSRKNPYVHDN